MIKFHDLSHWNTDSQFINAIATEPRVIAMKASEGETFKDRAFEPRCKKCGNETVIIAYHFLRADRNYNHPEKEMSNYLDTLRKMHRPFVMALDYESPFCNNNLRDFNFLAQCESYLVTRTGKAPYIYINESQLKSYERNGFKVSWLWLAKWSKEKPMRDFGIWQYTNKPLDTNFFVSDDLDLIKRHEVTI